MPMQLKTTHPLYANIVSFVCVDDDNTIKDLAGGRTLTPNAAVVTGTGTYGRHFRTVTTAGDARGVAVNPGIPTKPTGSDQRTTLFVVNNIASVSGANPRGYIYNVSSGAGWSPRITSSGFASIISDTGVTANGTRQCLNNGAHSVVGVVNGSTSAQVYVDGSVEVNHAGNMGTTGNSNLATYIGGEPAGEFGGLNADYVYVIHFNKALTAQEVSDLHSSLAANNTFALLEPPAANPVSFSGTINNQSASVGTAFSLNLSTFFTGSLTPFTYSLVAGDLTGTGLSLNTSTGVISGTPTSATTISGLQVRATDTGSNTAQTNTFSITVQAAGIGSAITYTVPSRVFAVQANATAPTVPSFTLTDLVNNAGQPLANTGGITVDVLNVSTGALVVRKTGLTSTAGADVVVSDAAMTAGTAYNVLISIGAAIGAAKVTAA